MSGPEISRVPSVQDFFSSDRNEIPSYLEAMKYELWKFSDSASELNGLIFPLNVLIA